MKKLLTIIAFLALCMSMGAQEMANIGKTINVISPEINGTTVTFRLEAPQARSVQVNGTMNEEYTIVNNLGGEARACKPVDMVKNSEGIWEYTCTCVPNFYNYAFIVDGVSICDPANPYRQRDGYDWLSAFIVDGPYSQNYKEANQRGNIHEIWYNSPTLDMDRRMIVYTPYGYDENPDKSYPVLYLMHGGMRDEEQWADLGLVHQILDNRIEKGEAEPMIVVMPNYQANFAAVDYIEVPGYRFSRDNRPDMGTRTVDMMRDDIIPYIDSHFRTIPDKAHRAIGGFSWGGNMAITCMLGMPEMFDYLFSVGFGAFESEQTVKKFEHLKEVGYKVVWIGMGYDDTGYETADTMHDIMAKLGMAHNYSVTLGGHAWYNSRYHLNAVAPYLFRDEIR